MIIYTALPRDFHSPVAKAILEMGAIRYVKISPKKEFFVIHFPGCYLEPFQEVEDSDAYSPSLIFGSNEAITMHSRNFCYVYCDGELMARKVDKRMEKYTGEMEDNFLARYQKQINEALPFQLNTYFTGKLITIDEKELGAVTQGNNKPRVITLVEYLVPRKEEIKIVSRKHWSAISDLLREIGLVKENRKRVLSSVMKELKEIIINEYRKNPKLTAKELEDKLAEEADKIFPDDDKQAEKCYRSSSQVWRWINTKK